MRMEEEARGPDLYKEAFLPVAGTLLALVGRRRFLTRVVTPLQIQEEEEVRLQLIVSAPVTDL